MRSNLEQGATFWFSLPKEAAPSLSADRAEPIDESNEPIFEQTIIVSLKFMAVPVLPLMAGQGGLRCHRYPGKPLDNDRAYNSLPQLIAEVATDQRRFVGAVLDNGFIDKEEWNTFKQLKTKVEELDRVGGENSINDYVSASKGQPRREARRLYFAGNLCRLIGDHQLAKNYYMKSAAMLRAETAPNLVAIADALTFAGQAAVESDIRSALAIRRDAVACVGEILPAQLVVQTEAFGDFINSLIDNGNLSEAMPLIKERSKQFNRACLEDRQSAAALWSVVQARIGLIQKNKPDDYKEQAPVYEEFLETMYKHAGAEEECTRALERLLRIYYTEETLVSADADRVQWCNKSIDVCSRYIADCHPLNPCDSKICCQLMLAKARAVKQFILKQYLPCAATCEAALKAGPPSVGSELRASLKEVQDRALKQ